MMISRVAAAATALLFAACTNTGGGDGGTTSSSSSSSSSSSGASSSSSGATSSSSSGGTSSGGCGIRQEGATCNATPDCQCGLSCIANQCLKSCTTPGGQDNCGSGQVCVAVTAGNVCLDSVGRDEGCAEAVCTAPLECQFSIADRDGNVDPEGMACHTPCNYGAASTGCTGGELCLPSTEGYYDPQVSNDAGVTCSVDAGSTACDTTNGFRCVPLTAGERCAKPVAACGTSVPLANLQPLPDGGTRTIPENELCNMGPQQVDTSGNLLVAGSRFCDDYRQGANALANPPYQTGCVAVFSDVPEFVGVCAAICTDLSDDGLTATFSDCPTGHFCDVVNTFYYTFVTVGADQTVPCTEGGTECSSHAGSTCVNFTTAGRICARPLGMCQPGTASTSSSSGGVSSSAAPGSSSAAGSSAAGSSAAGSSAGGSSAGGASSSGGAASSG